MLQRVIKELRENILEMAYLASQMIRNSMDSLLKKKPELAEEVIKVTEPKVNRKEIEIEDLAVKAIARFQPAAGDLRTIITIIKMNNDLERIADHAVNIAQAALNLIDKPPVKPLIDLPRMAEISMEMLNNAIKAFIDSDTELAREVLKRDDVVDNLLDQITRELITYMISDARTIERALLLILIARNFERIADLSTNIAEDVIYMVESKIVKHRYGG